MAKIKYDVTNVESRGDFKPPKPGLYTCTIDEVEEGQSKAGNDQLKIIFKVADAGEFKGANLFHYVPTDPEAGGFFRMDELVKALGLKPKGTIDTDKIVGTKVQVRVKADQYQGEYQARVGRVLPPKDADEDEAEDDEDLDEDEPGEDDDDEGDGYDDMSVAELRKECKERELASGGAKNVLIKRLRANDAEDEEEPEEDVDEEEPDNEDGSDADEGGTDDEDDYDEWSPDELKAELKTRGLRTAGKKAVLIGRLRKDDESDDDPFES
jgi:hypothetical protein